MTGRNLVGGERIKVIVARERSESHSEGGRDAEHETDHWQ